MKVACGEAVHGYEFFGAFLPEASGKVFAQNRCNFVLVRRLSATQWISAVKPYRFLKLERRLRIVYEFVQG